MPNAMDISPSIYKTPPPFSASKSPLDSLLGALTEQIQYAHATGNMHVISKAQLDAYTRHLLPRVPSQQNPKMATALRFFQAFIDFVYDVILDKKHIHTRDFDDRTDLVVYFSQVCDLQLTRNYPTYADRLMQSCLFPRGDIRSFIRRFEGDIAINATWQRYTRPLIALFEVYQKHGVFQQVKAHIDGIKNKARYAAPPANIQAEEDEMEAELQSLNPYYKKQKDAARQARQQTRSRVSTDTNRWRKDKEFLDSVRQMKTQKRPHPQYAPPPPPPRTNTRSSARPAPGPPPRRATPRASARSSAKPSPGPPPRKTTPRASARSSAKPSPGPPPRKTTPRANANTTKTSTRKSPSSFDEKAFEAAQRPLIRQEIENMLRQKSPKRVKREILLKYHPDKNPGSEARATVQFHVAHQILHEKGVA